MRLTDYSFVFDGWRLYDNQIIKTGFNLAVHTGLPYVEFHVVTDQGAASVRCDPCSLDQDRAAYAAMVRADLDKAMAKQRSEAPESDAPARLVRHLRESMPGMFQEAGSLTLYFHDSGAKALEAFWLIHEVMGDQTPDQSPGQALLPAVAIADSSRATAPSGNVERTQTHAV